MWKVFPCHGILMFMSVPHFCFLRHYPLDLVWPTAELHKVWITTLRPRQNWRHFTDDIFKCNFLNENAWILIKIPLNFVPKGLINNIPVLVQIMAWRHSGDKPLSEPMIFSLRTGPQCVTMYMAPCHILCNGDRWARNGGKARVVNYHPNNNTSREKSHDLYKTSIENHTVGMEHWGPDSLISTVVLQYR